MASACACAFSVAAAPPPTGWSSSNAAPRRSLRAAGSYPLVIARSSRNPTDAEADSRETQDDSSYLWKLGLGSVGGAAAIKYGSILFPDITRPNIVQALLMVSAPVVVAVVLLVKVSSTDD